MSKNDFRRMKEQLSPSENTINELYEKIKQEEEKPKRYSNFLKYGSIAACFLLVLVGVGIVASIPFNNDQNFVAESKPSEIITEDTSLIDKDSTNEEEYNNAFTDGKPIINKPEIYEVSDIPTEDEDIYLGTEFEFNGNKYIVINQKVSGYKFGERLESEEGYYSLQINSINSNKSLYVEVYEWGKGNISPEVAVAVGRLYTGQLDVQMLDPCYLCINKSYSAETFGKLINDFGIGDSVRFNNIEYISYDSMTASNSSYNVNSSDKELYNILFTDLSGAKANDDVIMTEVPINEIKFYISVDGIDMEILLDEAGYFVVKTGSISNRFYVDNKNKVLEIFDYVKTRYENSTNNSNVQDSNREQIDIQGSDSTCYNGNQSGSTGNSTGVQYSDASYIEVYEGEPVWDEYLGEYIILE